MREWAPEYYNTLHYHTSWVMCLWNFVFDKNMGPQSRVGRTHEAHKRGRKLAIPVDKDVPEKAAGMGERVDSGIMASE